eukprot:scaffold18177_cov77-Attheya_sp.AAC.1
MMKPPSKYCKPGHGAHIADHSGSAECNTKTTPPDIKPQTPHAPYPPLPNPPPSADWMMSESKHIQKPSSVPITHPPSMMRNAKSKSKSMDDDLDKATASDPMIVALPSTSKPPSETTKPKPKSVSAPQNENDTTDKETSPSPDTYCIPAVYTQWLFCFTNVPPLPKNAKPSKHKLLADPPTLLLK